MALNASNLVTLGVSNYSTLNDAELGLYAGCVAGALVMTHWAPVPVTHTAAKKAIRFVALNAGIPATDYDDKAGAIFKCAAKFATKMAHDKAIIAVRDAKSDIDALFAMKDAFALLGMTCRHYFKQWSNSPSCDKYDAEAIKAAKAAEKAAADRLAIEACLAMNSAVASSSADTAAIAPADTMTPVQRFALMVAAMADHAEIDAFHAVLSARQAELQAIADAASKVMPEALPGEAPVPRGKRAAKRKVALAA